MEKAKKWGGARPGAGRKPNPDKRVVLSCRVSSSTLKTIRAAASDTGTGIGEVIDFVVQDYLTVQGK